MGTRESRSTRSWVAVAVGVTLAIGGVAYALSDSNESEPQQPETAHPVTSTEPRARTVESWAGANDETSNPARWQYIGTDLSPEQFVNSAGLTLGRLPLDPAANIDAAWDAAPDYIAMADPSTGLIIGFVLKTDMEYVDADGHWHPRSFTSGVNIYGEDGVTILARFADDGSIAKVEP